jgi:hypothetical protein
MPFFYKNLQLSERDSSETTREAGDGADSPTRAGKAREAARSNSYYKI